MAYQANTALPYIDRDRAVTALRGHLRKLAADERAAPDWSTLRVSGPDEVVGAHGVVWYEWSATVNAHGEAASPETVDAARTDVRL